MEKIKSNQQQTAESDSVAKETKVEAKPEVKSESKVEEKPEVKTEEKSETKKVENIK